MVAFCQGALSLVSLAYLLLFVGASFYVVPGKRRDVYCCNDGFSYYRNKTVTHNRTSTHYLRCINYRKKQCTGLAQVIARQHQQRWFTSRDHVGICRPNIYNAQERQLRYRILQACRRHPYENPRQLLSNVCAEYSVRVSSRVRLHNFRHSMRRARLSQYPNVPATLHDLGDLLRDPNNTNITSTADGNDNIFAGTISLPGESCLVFVSQRMLKWLRRAKIVFSDATFAPTPAHPPGRQVWQIVTVQRYNVIPVVQVIMERKSKESYVAVLRHLRRIAPRFNPRKVMLDFEAAQQAAWREVYGCEIVNCYVHFARAIKKKQDSLGLRSRRMTRNKYVCRILRSSRAIPLLPRYLLKRGLATLIRYACRLEEAGKLRDFQFEGLQKYFSYFIRTWMCRRRLLSLSVYNEIHRTNNATESANRILRLLTGPHRPNIWKFINALQKYEQNAYTDVVAYRAGRTFGSSRKLSSLAMDERLQTLTSDLLEEAISIRGFLREASKRTLHFT